MTTTEIADELNKNKWYAKKDGSAIAPFQIHGRTRNYAHTFNRNGTTVSLKNQPGTKASTTKKEAQPAPKKLSDISSDTTLLEKVLMNEKNFKSADDIDGKVPDNPGLYCIRINDTSSIPKPFSTVLQERNHNIIYTGIASKSLSIRFLGQELRARGHGTFFRSIGAILGFRPELGSLNDKANKKNYTFSKKDENAIVKWINGNLKVNWVEYDGDFGMVETGIIERHLPIVNIAKNPGAVKELRALRAECVRIANSKS
jgi:hypothetical protein